MQRREEEVEDVSRKILGRKKNKFKHFLPVLVFRALINSKYLFNEKRERVSFLDLLLDVSPLTNHGFKIIDLLIMI